MREEKDEAERGKHGLSMNFSIRASFTRLQFLRVDRAGAVHVVSAPHSIQACLVVRLVSIYCVHVNFNIGVDTVSVISREHEGKRNNDDVDLKTLRSIISILFFFLSIVMLLFSILRK